mmetsp:Transcript_8642/g.13127  ORF Transcript_8642/g.13127 Transcript_8642/m.13127 type:complete len:274 (-) Transcript_8642:2-823(-)
MEEEWIIKWLIKEKEQWEKFVLYVYSPFWISVMAVIVVTGFYEEMGSLEYLYLGVGLCLPTFVFPFFSRGTTSHRWYERHWFKSIVWIAIVSYIGNHFFTHYFYQVLGCRYTTPTDGGYWSINDVPICMYLITYAYFMTYHVFVRQLLPSSLYYYPSIIAAIVFAWITAFMETLTISSFPHYRYPDLFQMLTFGSTFYMLFLSVSFVMYARLDSWCFTSLPQTIIEALATCMMVFILYDSWRLVIGGVGGVGGVVEIPAGLDCSGCGAKVPYS